MNVIEARGLTRTYGGRAVVSDFTMTVAAGDIYGFVGKNGAGKSTVMKMICGDVLPTAGEVVLFEGDRAQAESGVRAPGPGLQACGGVRRIGVLIEEPALLPNLSAYRNLMAKALAWGIVDGSARCEEALRLVGLSSLGNPDVLLLDEPFNGLDPEATRAMRNLIVRLAESLGITVVVSSHVPDQLERVATRYGVIADGRMVREMTAEEVAAECRSSLRVRTENAARTLALLEEAYPALSYRVEPDQAIVVTGDYDDGAVSRLLAQSSEVVRELSRDHRDLEDYFVELMEGGTCHV